MNTMDISLDLFSADALTKRTVENNALTKMTEAVTNRRYFTKQLGIDRGTFHHWNRKGLIPYQKREESGWQKFSFIECVWLGVLKDLRALGISLDLIKKIKEQIFDDSYAMIIEHDRLMLSKMLEEDDLDADYRRELEKLKREWDIKSIEEQTASMVESQLSTFLGVVVSCLCARQRHYIIVTAKGIVGLYSEVDENLIVESGQSIKPQMLTGQSHVKIDIWNIICGLLQLDSVSLPSPVLEESLTDDEQQIIRFIREKGIDTIQIEKGADGQPTIIRVTKSRIDQKVMNKLYPFIKKGDFSTWSFSNRDGKIVKFQQTEVVKLKN